jgi:Domain of unknown function (DUF4783)
MKTMLFLVSMLFMGSNTVPNLSAVTKAISDGDAVALGSFCDANVEITILDNYNSYDRAAAVRVMSDFFAKNKPRTFSMVHQGSSKGSAVHYSIGDLQTVNGNFRLSIYYKLNADKVLIQEMRLEK